MIDTLVKAVTNALACVAATASVAHATKNDNITSGIPVSKKPEATIPSANPEEKGFDVADAMVNPANPWYHLDIF